MTTLSESSERRATDPQRAFRAALVLRGTTGAEFARTLGVSTNHFWCVVRGERRSQRIEAAIQAVIADAFQ